MRTLCERGNGFAFGDFRDSPNTPIEPRVARPGERPQQAPPVDPAERRAGRAGSAHSITVGPAHSCCKTSGYLLSKWNRIEHRLFAFIAQNWRGKPRLSHQLILQLISATTTKTGLNVACRIDANEYPKGIVVTDAEIAAINLTPNTFHGEWNYTISPSAGSE